MDKSIESQNFFDRQERILWWDQQLLYNAKVLVVGAGALGNEAIKNLALLGVGLILVVDLDIIEESNLSRAVLFRIQDAAEGASKALVAAERAQVINPYPLAKVVGIHGDMVWELGAGVFRRVDLVLGCVDNLEARQMINLRCWQVSKGWIDGGMWELSGSVTVYDSSPEKACFECALAVDDYKRLRVRYSCGSATVKTNIRQGREPTTQTTSALVSALQVQEGIKILHGLPSFPGRRAVFNGAQHFYLDNEFSPISMSELALNPACFCHSEDRFEHVLELPNASAAHTTSRQLLQMVEAATGCGNWAVNLGREYVTEAECPLCETRQRVEKPLYRVKDVDVVCKTCEVQCTRCNAINRGTPDCMSCGQPDILEPRLKLLNQLSLQAKDSLAYLDVPLAQLGIPPLHILKVYSADGLEQYVELSGDPFPPHNLSIN